MSNKCLCIMIRFQISEGILPAHISGEGNTLCAVLFSVYSRAWLPIFFKEISSYLTDPEQNICRHGFFLSRHMFTLDICKLWQNRKQLWKLVHYSQSYEQKSSICFLDRANEIRDRCWHVKYWCVNPKRLDQCWYYNKAWMLILGLKAKFLGLGTVRPWPWMPWPWHKIQGHLLLFKIWYYRSHYVFYVLHIVFLLNNYHHHHYYFIVVFLENSENDSTTD